MKMVLTLAALVLLAVGGVAYFTANEGWTAIQAFYWTTCTMAVRGKLTTTLALELVNVTLNICFVSIDRGVWRHAATKCFNKVNLPFFFIPMLLR